MKTCWFRTGAAAVLGMAGISALLAQSVEGLDVQEIKARAAGFQKEAEAFASHVKDRGDSFRKEAAGVQKGGIQAMREMAAGALPPGLEGAVDFDEIVAGAAANLDRKAGEAPQFIAFASFSMPPASLKQMVRDTAKAGGLVVFRGFPDNSMKAFSARLGKIVDEQDLPNIGIDPRLFRAFDVQAVPTYVAVSSDFDPCSGFDCRTNVPPHDRITGNVTVHYALSSFSEGNGPGARIAAIALSSLTANRP
ncbi:MULTISPECIES: type-F conjugative transfer system pilin assembly protein TrbC [Sphingobium]|uniref:Pilus assembly protein n=1 Tax=Sphingobium chungbukense TaxID=56193 RepID=A0A0M3AKS6_9SPHN|nr:MULTISPECIES: type-F conjugative transfer system pilin assembly protein TrbC [Sphingobium]AMK26068.1 type-F conjugative transfer system pilin assembly protein TrbC [Sphingobium sp. TKS]KKW90563.1 pilus assembly protein [Sphingobium chungbukense]